ncbi:MAG: glycosyltransferase family 4 protein, partial [Deltaproteobacteria bacterium]|nr:glycosyltransferase family 4 protein [Deltaproteobacteria bacterium]
TVHGWGHPVFSSKIKRAVFKFLERVCEPFTDKLIVVSSLNADKGLQDGIGTPDKYTTIHSCINIDDFSRPQQDISALKAKLGLRPDALVVGTVGRLSPQKNPADFVRVAARVKRDIPRAQFIFVGDGPLRPETEALIRQHNLEKDVLLPGLSSEVPDLLHCMDLFMLTSLWEGLPRVIPQAMAAGLPVVANGVDGVCEVIKDGTNGFFLRPHDIEGMSQKIIRLLSDPELYRSVADQGLRTAREEFSVWNMINQIETVYEHFLAARAPRA